nr:WecB/TagA/CpsF family glycosyltransferase [Euzebyales bacterium]
AAHRGSVRAAMMAVGAAFDYYAGTLARPPAWMQRAGLEWLFRLTQDPKRLWRRYLVHNTLFVAYLLRALLQRSRVRIPTAALSRWRR